MKHFKHASITQATLVTPESLEKFEKFLLKHFKKIEYSSKLNDGTTINFLDIKDLLDYQNPNHRMIQSIELTCIDDKDYSNREKSLNINLKNEETLIKPLSASYTLQYESRDWGFAFEDELISEIKDLKPIYNYITYFNLTIFPLLSIAGLLLLLLFIDGLLKVSGAKGYFEDSQPNQTQSAASITIPIMASIMLFIIGYYTNKTRNYLFPVFSTTIGKQLKTYNQKMMISQIIFGIIILGIVVNYISDKLF